MPRTRKQLPHITYKSPRPRSRRAQLEIITSSRLSFPFISSHFPLSLNSFLFSPTTPLVRTAAAAAAAAQPPEPEAPSPTPPLSLPLSGVDRAGGGMAQKLQQQLKEVGSKLETPPASKDALVKLLKQAVSYLSEIGQSPLPSILEAMQPFLNAIVKPELFKHQDRDVEVLVATCICEITRITAPEAPYSDEILRDIFHLFVGTFSGLNDINSPSFGRRVVILETLARYRSCVMMLDLECVDLINKMFSTFFAAVSDDHPESVLMSIQTIMTLIIDESEDVQENLLFTILSTLGRNRSDVSVAARRLAMDVIEHCAGKLEPYIKQFLLSSISGDTSTSSSLDYHEVIYDLYRCAPQILFGIIPYITGELLTGQLDVRLKAVKLLGDVFALPGISVSDPFRLLFSEFLKRLTDRVVEVRISVIEHVKDCLMSNPSRPEAPEIISSLCDRLLDYDENVRKQVVAAIFVVARHSLKSIPSATIRLVSERLRDKSVSVKRYTMERLAELYRLYCEKNSDDSINGDNLEWIPGKILRCLYDKDFRLETIEDIMCNSLFPPEFSVKDKLKHWIAIFSGFDKIEVKALEQVLLQKQRFQQELQKYLSLRQTNQDGDGPEIQKRILACFRTLSRLFSDPVKAEESFQTLNQLKDGNIWKILLCLLDPCTSFQQASVSRNELLRILGEKHSLYDFMGTLSIKCSYLLFNKDIIKAILSEAATQQCGGDAKLQSCMNFLAVLASFSPSLLSGFEEDLVCLLKQDNEIIKEGIANVLARAGGVIREKLAMTSSSVDLLLERLCLEGSRKQAKYSVQALAAITKDDGLKSLSVLYKRLVDMLEEKTHLPAILQSLGCIAQNAMPVFETREGEIVDFITHKILECSNKEDDSKQKSDWSDRSEFCLLKIFGIKTLVKSYMPIKDAHLRLGIEKLLQILKNILLFGEISKNIESSSVDKAHLRLAAAKAILRLSKQWDHKIPVDIFYLTLRTSEDIHPQSRKLFISKVHQYIKERFLDAKYACAFLYNLKDPYTPDINEEKHYLVEVVQMHNQLKARQLSMQCDTNSLVAYPEYILMYLVHALAHHPSFPNIDCEEVQAFEPIYWRLHFFLSSLFHGDEAWQAGAHANRTKESLFTLMSILYSIKCSEDVVDETRTKNSHALCDLGISIAKRLAHEQQDLIEPTASVPLPTLLFTPLQKNSDDSSLANEVQSWLGGASALAHFESLKLENKTDSGAGKDENISKDSDIDADGTELPLGKIMQNLKSRGAKNRKMVKKQTGHSEIKNSDEVDVLGMVREINLGNEEGEHGMDSHKVERNNKHSASANINVQNKGNKSSSSVKKNRNKNSSLISMSTPKRKRSPFVPKSHSKDKRISGESLSPLSIEAKEKATSTNSDLLVSSLPTTKTFASGSRKKSSYHSSNGKLYVSEDYNGLKKSTVKNEIEKNGSSNLSSDHTRKRKAKGIAGLVKCSEKQLKNESELVGCRIKVWWPMDKQFYEGKVKSYDPGKKKHVILYDDGDVEVLCLDKERWELVSDDNTPKKKRKSQHSYSSEELSADEGNDRSKEDRPRKKKKPKKKAASSRVRRKATGKEKYNESRIPESKSDVESSDAPHGADSNVSDADVHAGSDIDDAHSDSSREKPETLSESGEKLEPTPMEVLEETAEEERHDSSSSSGYPEGGKTIKHDSVNVLEETAEGDEHDSSSGQENSDAEPLSSWKQRALK